MSLREVGAITVFVDDVPAARRFYETVFDAKLVFEDDQSAAFAFGDTIVNLLARSEAPALVEPAPVAPAGAGSSFQLTIWVEDADAACAELARQGVTLLNGPADRAWGVRTAAFADPGGVVWEVAQRL